MRTDAFRDQVVIVTGASAGIGKAAVWLKLLAPGLLDWATIKIFLEPAIRRAKAGRIEMKS